MLYAAVVGVGFLLQKHISADGWVPVIVLWIVSTALFVEFYVYLWRRGDLGRDPRTGMPFYQLRGWEAKRFIKKRLEQVAVDAAARTTTYRNPREGSIWVTDYPPGDRHPPRLRRLRD